MCPELSPTPDETSLRVPDIKIRVSMPQPWTHCFGVRITVSGQAGDLAWLRMPVWTPGSYMVREYSRNVHDFSAHGDSGAVLAWEKTDKCTWLVHTQGENRWFVEYRVYAFELTVRTCFLDDSHGYINGAGLFMYLDGFQENRHQLEIVPYEGWTVISTGLEKCPGEDLIFSASDFDTLIDCPIEIGNQEVLDFEVQQRPHHIAVYGGGEFDRERLKTDFKKIVETCADLMGDIPYAHYTFLIHLISDGRGGLEHANSVSLQASRWFHQTPESYNRFLDLVAHEFFHLWNIKRLRPVELGPFDYLKENYTRQLWVSEGFTDYYSSRIMRRAGFLSPDGYLTELSKSIRELQETPGRSVQSAAESSFDAWIKFYRPDANSPNETISYYLKGSLIALVLDLEIRNRSLDHSLDDVMRRLYLEYYREKGRGFTEEEFRSVCEWAAGGPLDEIFDQYAYGTQEIDFARYLGYAGLKFADTAEARSNGQAGHLGASIRTVEGRVCIHGITAGGPAWIQGLNIQDEILAVNGYRASQEFISSYLPGQPPGTELQFLVSRDGRLRTFVIRLGEKKENEFKIERIQEPSAQQRLLYESWIFAPWESLTVAGGV